MHAARLLCLALVAVTSAACASTGATTSIEPGLAADADGARPARARRLNRTGDVISYQEIARERASSAYELVERLRPYFLRGRSMGLMEPGPLVYMDDTMLGDVRSLRMVNANDVLEIRYVKGEMMRTHIGTASGRQVIQIVTKRW